MRRIAEIGAHLWVLTETDRRIVLPGLSSIATNRPVLSRYGDEEAYAAIHYDANLRPRKISTFDPCFAVCLAFDSSPIGPMIVYGTIITYMGDDYGGAAYGELHESAVRAQGADWERITTELPQHALLVAGDFNHHLDGVRAPGTQRTDQSDRDLAAAFANAKLRCVTTGDYRLQLGGRRNIDHIAVSESLACHWTIMSSVWRGTTTDGTELSDHNGTTITLDSSAQTQGAG